MCEQVAWLAHYSNSFFSFSRAKKSLCPTAKEAGQPGVAGLLLLPLKEQVGKHKAETVVSISGVNCEY